MIHEKLEEDGKLCPYCGEFGGRLESSRKNTQKNGHAYSDHYRCERCNTTFSESRIKSKMLTK